MYYNPAAPLTPLETALLQTLADYHQEPALTEQLNCCQVVQREYSGCGFFTTLVLPAGMPPIRASGVEYHVRNGPDFDSSELLHGGGSVLFMKEGLVDCLEVFAYDNDDPTAIQHFRLLPMEPDRDPM